MAMNLKTTVFNQNKYLFVVVGVIILAILLSIGAFFAWHILQPKSQLPGSLQARVSGFTPYFYSGDIPAGYNFDSKQVTASNDILIVPVTRPDGASVVITQQPMPAGLSENQILSSGNRVEGALSPAIVGKVDGRTVGTMVASSNGTLILLNAQGSVSEDDIAALIRGLQPLK